MFNIELKVLNNTDKTTVLKCMLYTREQNYRSSERKKFSDSEYSIAFSLRIEINSHCAPVLPQNSCLFVWILNPRNHAIEVDPLSINPWVTYQDTNFRLFCIKCKININGFINQKKMIDLWKLSTRPNG